MTDIAEGWPRYRSHRLVHALPIVLIYEVEGEKAIYVDLERPGEPAGREQFRPNSADMLRLAQLGDYAVLYDDGYRSICPKGAFESGYERMS